MVALAYDRAEPVPADALLRGKIARYSRGEDHHLVMRDRLVAHREVFEGDVPPAGLADDGGPVEVPRRRDRPPAVLSLYSWTRHSNGILN